MKKTRGAYSAKSSTVKALLVGINYNGTRNHLGGCINDVLESQRRILTDYPNATIKLMTDDTKACLPTRNNILSSLKTLIDNAEAGDILFFHYSGHGGQVPDLHGDEEDGMDETLCPIDFLKPRIVTVNGINRKLDSQIIDDEIHDIISHTPKGARFLMLSDSCHSGTIADLKHDFLHSRSNKSFFDPVSGQHRHFTNGRLKTLAVTTCSGDCGGELRVISGCEEGETSADTGNNGACTKAVWATVDTLGGLPVFFTKIFSRNVEDLKLVQDTVNAKLSIGGYEQHSLVSWEIADDHVQHQAKPQVVEPVSYMPFYQYIPACTPLLNYYHQQQPSYSYEPSHPVTYTSYTFKPYI